MTDNPVLRRVLPVLYADWFAFLPGPCPRGMWLVEINQFRAETRHVHPAHVRIDRQAGIRNVYYLDRTGFKETSRPAWLRYSAVHLDRLWYSGEQASAPFSLPLCGTEQRFEVGFGLFGTEPATQHLFIELYLAARHSAGYLLNADGHLVSDWKSWSFL
ncbi:hypothetical protein [Deinococcus altitudinis]|uniref:hypothetical protein n=1 Tax=Deinococcus altitudinis TaxID=468914 RepID=UPI003891CA8C